MYGYNIRKCKASTPLVETKIYFDMKYSWISGFMIILMISIPSPPDATLMPP